MEFPQDRFRENLSPSQTNVGDLSGDRPERLTPPLTTYDSRPPAADHPMDLSNSFTHRLILRIILIVAASILVAALAWARVRKS
jgi:hypothetical protein